ncbi:MAG: alpha/beta hydrolase [Kibdelosporangium sp.]
MTYAIDPELAPWLDMMPTISLASAADVVTARALLTERWSQVPRYEPETEVEITDTVVPGSPDVPVRVYRPAGGGPRPGLLYIHGGGFIIGTIDMMDPLLTEVVDKLGVVVVSVDYRLAPEHPFPAPADDCYAALAWMANKATELGVDADRIGIAGESAGGGLAAGVALMARDRGGPALCFQYLGVPEIDDRLTTDSMTAYVDTPIWSRPKAELSWASYLGSVVPGSADVSPYAAPARAADLSGLPPTVVTACQFDPLRDEDIEYARRLLHAGVPTELRAYAGTFHGSASIAEAAVTKRMKADLLDDLRRGLQV